MSKQKSILSFFSKSDEVHSKKNKTVARNPKKRYTKTRINNFFRPADELTLNEPSQQEESEEEEEEEEEEEPVVLSRKRKRRSKVKVLDDDDEDNQDAISIEDDCEALLDMSLDSDSEEKVIEEQVHNIPTNPQEDNQDINSDLRFLDKADILEERTRGKQVSRYSEALAKLKDRKTKLNSYKGSKGPIERYQNAEMLSESDEYNSDYGEDDGFIVDDDIVDGVRVTNNGSDISEYLGHGQVDMEMPAEFSSSRTQSWSSQFTTFILSLVHQINNDSNEQSQSNKYEMAERVVVGRIQAYKDSIVTSDVWLPHFKEALDGKEIWINAQTNYSRYTPCEGCRVNRNTHGRKVVLRSEGVDLEPSSFFLGSDCFRKSKMYHHLTHFKFHMYTKVNQEINKMSNEMNRELRLTTDIICQELIDSGFIKRLYKDLKSFITNLVVTYNIKSERFRFGNDSSSSEDET